MKVVYTKQQRMRLRTHKFHDCKYDERSRNGSWHLVTGLSSHWQYGYGNYKYHVQKGIRTVKNKMEVLDIVFRNNIKLPKSTVLKVPIISRTNTDNIGVKNYRKFN